MTRFVTYGVAVVLSATLLSGVGCGPNGDNNGSNFPNNTTSDTGDTTVDGDNTDTDMNDAGDSTSEDAEGDAIIGQSCEARPEDLGTLAVGDSLDLDRPFRVRPSETKSSCQEPETRAGIYVFELQVEETSKLQLGLFASAASSPTLEMREGECLEQGMPVFCGDEPSRTAVLEPGISYYVFVQGSADSEAADFRITLDVSTAACGPSDEICESGAQQTCDGGDRIVTRNCAADCSSEDACVGEVCSSAISVDLAANASQTFTGDQFAYRNDWNADGRANCALDETGAGQDTPNVELFFELTGHSQGDNILFDAEASQSNFGFYVLDACDATGCIDAGAYPEELGPNQFTWRATTSDPVYVAAEVLGDRQDRTLEITITKE